MGKHWLKSWTKKDPSKWTRQTALKHPIYYRLTIERQMSLGTACVKALLDNRTHIAVKCLTQHRMPAGFPDYRLESYKDGFDVRLYNAKSVLDWLNEKGHFTFTAQDIGRAKAMFTRVERSLDFMEGDVAIDQD